MTSNDTSAGQAEPQAPKRGFPVLVLLPLVVFAGLAALFLFQLTLGGDPQKIPSALINKPAPEFDLPPVEGLTRGDTAVAGFSRQDLNGKISVVNVFASWCVPCRQEHPLLEDLAKVEGIQLLGINYKDKPENARRFLGSLGNPYQRVGADTGGRTAIEWGVYGVPETFVIDADGMIRYKFIGPLSLETYQEVFLPELRKIMAGDKS
ncbi:DsbE family thiol:disulfide interchange protein [Stappia sp. BW2]|uniref:DsbE family thiol:disulfide interchange protein n=1 Tax=Stappia sp. BW2 TaxID=2592622 RepID=UPI001967B191|nr:DsbE family thiol:disulfide interchange protein [Stappia sp. BW2]